MNILWLLPTAKLQIFFLTSLILIHSWFSSYSGGSSQRFIWSVEGATHECALSKRFLKICSDNQVYRNMQSELLAYLSSNVSFWWCYLFTGCAKLQCQYVLGLSTSNGVIAKKKKKVILWWQPSVLYEGVVAFTHVPPCWLADVLVILLRFYPFFFRIKDSFCIKPLTDNCCCINQSVAWISHPQLIPYKQH